MGLILKPRIGERINFSHPLARGLAACWVMNEGSADTIHDLTGSGNNGTLSGPTWVSGKTGQALDFDGNTHYINCGTNLPEFPPMSIMGWGKLDTISGAHEMAARWGSNHSFQILNSWGNLRVYSRNASGAIYYGTGTDGAFTTGWHLVGFTMGASDTQVIGYLDNIRYTFTGYAWDDSTLDMPLLIGKKDDGDRWAGLIEQVLFYDRVLSVQEVAWLYREPYAMFEQVPIWMYYTEAPPVGVAPTGALYGPLVGALGGPI